MSTWDRSAWYVDPVDGVDTIDLDVDFDGYLKADFTRDGRFAGLTDATALPAVPEGGEVEISDVLVLAGPVLTFRASGSGALVTFRFTGTAGPVFKNDWTARLRARAG